MANFGEYTFKSGKHEGKTYDEVMETEEGRSTFRWMLNQELPQEPDKEKLKFWLINRNKWIQEKLEMHPEDPEIQEKKLVKGSLNLTETASYVVTQQLADHEARIKSLEQKVGKDEIQWEE